MRNFSEWINSLPLREAFDSPYVLSGGTIPFGLSEIDTGVAYRAETPDGRLEIDFWKDMRTENWSVDFSVNGSYRVLLNSPNVFRILATVLHSIKTFIKAHEETFGSRPKSFTITSHKNKITDPSSKKESDRRYDLYMRMASRFASKEGYEIRTSTTRTEHELISRIELRKR